jgi:hypothetical protein
MTKLRINFLAIASLLIVGSTLGAPAAWAGSRVHAQAIRHGSVLEMRVHGRGGFVAPPARATQPHEQDPFADLLLG